jgi:uncharacterized OB-fold protein
MTARAEVGKVLPLRVPPFLDPDNTAFWTGGREGQLLIMRCGDCGWWTHPAAPRCRRCRSANVEPQAVSGKARVASYTVNYKDWIPGSEPYIIAQVELEEQAGLFLTTNLVDVEAEDIEIGMDVTLVFEESNDIWYPLFRPAT